MSPGLDSQRPNVVILVARATDVSASYPSCVRGARAAAGYFAHSPEPARSPTLTPAPSLGIAIASTPALAPVPAPGFAHLASANAPLRSYASIEINEEGCPTLQQLRAHMASGIQVAIVGAGNAFARVVARNIERPPAAQGYRALQKAAESRPGWLVYWRGGG
ncbi:hypothetical protein B0H10DRAFT_2436924 [Mycena sp. CBHHK59/15]|nr:hypothetical protein B0H10DRAFT_2436924 [Mycena sp. CBHHK59/15]